jgi:Zn-dependent protease
MVFIFLREMYKPLYAFSMEGAEKMRCQKCGEETFLPFQCPYCGGQFCTAHRLPENHDCPKMDRARASKQEEVLVLKKPSSYEHTVSYEQPRMRKGCVYFSPKELKHLAVAGLLVIGIAFSSALYVNAPFEVLVWGLAIFAVVLTVSFLAHEIAHKVIAQRRGLWAEFRLTLWGSVLTLVSFISPLFKIISPGAVMISGSAGAREMGKISLVGPATNIVVSAVLLGLSPFVPSGFVWAVMLGAFLNAFMAVFNLIPFGIFDGFKIYSWDKKVWGLVFAVSLVLATTAYVRSGF